MRKLNLKNREEYWAWLASGQRPKNIPYSLEKVYKHTGWVDLVDWLGTSNKSGRQKRNWLSYNEVKIYDPQPFHHHQIELIRSLKAGASF